jgi:hypothetical protein
VLQRRGEDQAVRDRQASAFEMTLARERATASLTAPFDYTSRRPGSGKTVQNLLAEDLNDLFSKYNVPQRRRSKSKLLQQFNRSHPIL